MTVQEQLYYFYTRRLMNLANYFKLAGQQNMFKADAKPASVDQLKDALSDPSVTNIQLVSPLEITDSTITIGDGVNAIAKTIDLNGMPITNAVDSNIGDSIFSVKRNATLTIVDSGNGKVTALTDKTYAALKLTIKGEDDDTFPAKVVIDGGTFSAKYYALVGNGSRGNTEIIINGGKFEGLEENDSAAIFHPLFGKMTINNGEFTANGVCVWVKAGNIIINGGKFGAYGESAPYKYSGNGFNSTGACIVVDNCGYPGSVPNVSINGGSFFSKNDKPIASYEYGTDPETGLPRNHVTHFVRGGIFNTIIDNDLIADGYKLIAKSNYYEVVKA